MNIRCLNRLTADDGGTGGGGGAPAEYQFTVPEGSGLDAADVTALGEYAKTNKWTQDQASAELTRRHELIEGYRKRNAPVVPDKYELKLAQDSPLHADNVAAVTALAKEKKWTLDHAQAVLDQRHEAAADVLRRQQGAWEAQRAGWKTALEKEWGPNFDANAQTAERGLEWMAKTGTAARESIDKFLDDSGLRGNPTVMNLFLKIGEANKEDGGPAGGGTGGGEQKPATVIDRMTQRYAEQMKAS